MKNCHRNRPIVTLHLRQIKMPEYVKEMGFFMTALQSKLNKNLQYRKSLQNLIHAEMCHTSLI